MLLQFNARNNASSEDEEEERFLRLNVLLGLEFSTVKSGFACQTVGVWVV